MKLTDGGYSAQLFDFNPLSMYTSACLERDRRSLLALDRSCFMALPFRYTATRNRVLRRPLPRAGMVPTARLTRFLFRAPGASNSVSA